MIKYSHPIIFISTYFLLLTILFFSGTACKKFIDPGAPVTELVAGTVYTNDQKATATILSIYSGISGTNFSPGGNQSFSTMGGLSADELIDYSITSGRAEYYANAVSVTNTTNLAIWRNTYQYIYQANAVLEGLEKSSGVSAATKKDLQGQAKFIRAFLYFYLTNCWGDVPYVTTSDYTVNSIARRTPQAEIYKGIIADLLEAQDLLSDTDVSGNRIQPSKWAAKALLSRAYLFLQNWQNAESAATEVISHSSAFTLLPDITKVFLKDSRETIWQLMPVVPDHNSSEGYNYILTTKPNYVALSAQIVNAFEAGDKRKANWVGNFTSGSQSYYFTSKYKVKIASSLSEYSVILRLSELYLIRAEARARQNKLTGPNSAVADIDLLRIRAGLSPSLAVSQLQILDAVMQERKVELFTEWETAGLI